MGGLLSRVGDAAAPRSSSPLYPSPRCRFDDYCRQLHVLCARFDVFGRSAQVVHSENVKF
jgi:hypothetical protein